MTEDEAHTLAATKNDAAKNDPMPLSYRAAKRWPGNDAPWCVYVFGPLGTLVQEIRELADDKPELNDCPFCAAGIPLTKGSH